MLDERKAAILRAVVEEYIETAQPVGSGTWSRPRGRTCRRRRCATRWRPRAEGYLRQPHTSAGRVPTDKGYRFFVDTPRRGRRSSTRRRPSRSARSSPRPTASSSRCCTTPRGCCPTSPTTPASSSARPPRPRRSARSSSSASTPRVALVVVVLVERRGREAHLELADDTGDERLGGGHRPSRRPPRRTSPPAALTPVAEHRRRAPTAWSAPP